MLASTNSEAFCQSSTDSDSDYEEDERELTGPIVTKYGFKHARQPQHRSQPAEHTRPARHQPVAPERQEPI